MAEPNLNLPRHHNAYKVSVSSLKGKNKRWRRAPKVARERASRAFQIPGFGPSMGSVGDCYDNALCGSFFASLECELLDRNPLPNADSGRSAVFDFIEGIYNPHRLHSSLGYYSPAEFERRSATLPTVPN